MAAGRGSSARPDGEPALGALGVEQHGQLVEVGDVQPEPGVTADVGHGPRADPLGDALLRVDGDAVGEVVGAADAEEILGEIFSAFCIGK